MEPTNASHRARPTRHARAVRQALLAAAAVTLAGCADLNGPTAPTGGTSIDGAWVLVAGSGPQGPLPIVSDAVTLLVEEDEWGGTAACNHYGGAVEVDGDRVRVREVFRTEMACLDDRLMRLEDAYLDAFAVVERAQRIGDELVLTGVRVELRFAPVPPEPDAPLVGTHWELDTLVEGTGDTSAVSSVFGSPPLLLTEDGTLEGGTGCNRIGGRYQPAGDRLRIDALATTKVGCDEPLTRQEAHLLAVLGSDPLVVIEGSRLMLTAPDGRGLGYRVADNAGR
jgi:heat shock protein HslJ